jgi:uncharacterized repeat protein (TIGR03803 family)
MLLLAVTMIALGTADAQTFNVLYSFTGGTDGSQPWSGLIQVRGALYGTTFAGGNGDNGVVYRLSNSQSGWSATTLAEFGQLENGYPPYARLTLGPDAALYGTAVWGGLDGGCYGSGCGTVFRLNPSASFSRTVIYRFSGSDGAFPDTELTFDRNGNMFGTSPHGGTADQGTVFELARNGNGWNESVLYDFADFKPPGNQPVGGVILDSAGNIYGTTLTRR